MIIIILWRLLRVINSPSWLCSFYFNFVCRLVSSSGNHAVFGFSDRVLDSSWKSSNSSTCCCLITLQDKDHVTNEEVRTKIQQAIGPHEDLLTTVKRRKQQWYGHVSSSSGLAKTILQGTVKKGRRQGRQRKRWEDNIREWTGLEFAKSQRAVKNRGKWRKLVTKSSVVPQRPSRLRDRWDEMRFKNAQS